MSQNAGQPTRTSGRIALSRRSGLRRERILRPRAAAQYGRVRMMTRALAASALLTVTLGGAVFASSDAGQPAAKCKSVSEQVETRAVQRPAPGTYSGPSDQTGTQQRTVTVAKCRGKMVTAYTAWS